MGLVSQLPGGEISKDRPAVIVSNDVANRLLNRIQVVPLTTQVAKVYPGEAVVDVRGKKRKAMADQIVTADKSRVQNLVGRLSMADMEKVEHALTVQLGLS